MKNDGLRKSFLKSYMDCELRAAKDAEAGDDELDPAEHLRFGQVCHSVAQVIGERARDGKLVETKVSAWDLFIEAAKAERLSSTAYFHDRKTVEQWVDRLLLHLRWPTKEKVLGVELKFKLDIKTPNGIVPIKGTMDRVGLVSPTTLRVTDYKSNRVPFTRDDIENGIELQHYALAAFYLADSGEFPGIKTGQIKKVQVCYDMIRFHIYDNSFERQDLEEYVDWLDVMWHVIQENKNPQPRINTNCSWCNHKMDCPAFIEMMKNAGKLPVIAMVDPNSEHEQELLWGEYQRLAATLKVLEKRKDEIGAVIRELIAGTEEGEVKIGEEKVYLQTNPRYGWNIDKVYRILKAADALNRISEVVKVQNEPMRKLIASGMPAGEALAAIEETEYVSPSLKSKKVK